LHGLGKVHFEMGELDQAEMINRKVYDLDNDDIQALTSLGNILFCLNVVKYLF